MKNLGNIAQDGTDGRRSNSRGWKSMAYKFRFHRRLLMM
jgi:hypothetical protein